MSFNADRPAPIRLRQGPHPAALRALHWGVALAVLAEFTLALARMAAESDSWRHGLMAWHQPLGLLIGAATLLRLGTRLRLRLARWQGSRWIAWTSAGLHGLSYLLLLALPLVGLALANARGHAVSLPLLGTLPRLMARDLDLADTLEDAHATLAWLLLGLIALHAAAAAWHQWVRRDGLLDAMWPASR
ncbi:cytochrome b/b6 domain-containing protein [Roseateles cellulosilyticus]|uniref:Cytochrome b/b6 domain-containing protein n=1 Tax=Pelomonas cellulosilytica TaxID=2906762 RepID=A0ABS8Y2F4_9BURK|nr:cytochrome b/b6 domain-containing protein [Pelomonas sp. P8]MCE4558215.1 cytochrome b/b6 domain-containing protein [Pelomonas sp. P8]